MHIKRYKLLFDNRMSLENTQKNITQGTLTQTHYCTDGIEKCIKSGIARLCCRKAPETAQIQYCSQKNTRKCETIRWRLNRNKSTIYRRVACCVKQHFWVCRLQRAMVRYTTTRVNYIF